MFLRLSTHSSTLQEVGILPTLVYFYPKGLILGEMLCRGPKGLFGSTRNNLRPFSGIFRVEFRNDLGLSMAYFGTDLLPVRWIGCNQSCELFRA